jgi:hypothetical protein
MTTFYYGNQSQIIQIAGEMTSQSYTNIPNNFTNVDIGSDVTSLGDNCFSLCESLKTITIPLSVISIGNYCFYYCSALTTLDIPLSVTFLGDFCFIACAELETITISPNVTFLGESCFHSCISLTTIDIPPNVTFLGNSCFEGCIALTTLTIPLSVTSLGDSCFEGCYSLTTIDIPPFITSLGISCFNNCANLLTITIPPSITSLSESCFQSCNAFIAITVPSNITSIGPSCFNYCYNLTIITIPSNITSIGPSCFTGCRSLKTIIFELKSVGQIELSQNLFKFEFSNISVSQTVIFYNASSSTDLLNTGLDVLVNSPDNYFTNTPSYVYLPSTNTLASYNDGSYQSSNSSSYNDISNNFISIILGSNVDTIGENSLQYSSATSLNLSPSITTIANNAFTGSNLVTGNLSTVKFIGSGAFSNSLNLVAATLPIDLLNVPDNIFNGCTNFTSYSSSSSVTPTSLTTMIIPLTITSFGEDYDTATTVIFSSSTISIGVGSFSYTGIIKVIIPSSITSIGEDCFRSSPSLNTIVFEDGRRKVTFGSYLFWNISSSIIVKFYNVSSYSDLSLQFRKLVDDVTTSSYKYFNTSNVTFHYMTVKIPRPVLTGIYLPNFYNNKSKTLAAKRIKKNISKNFSY